MQPGLLTTSALAQRPSVVTRLHGPQNSAGRAQMQLNGSSFSGNTAQRRSRLISAAAAGPAALFEQGDGGSSSGTADIAPPASSNGSSSSNGNGVAHAAAHASSNGNGATGVLEQPSTSGRSDGVAVARADVRGARVEVQGMVKHFETKRGLFKAVDGVSVEMQPGTITALLGPSGSGKTTLLRLVAGLEEPTAGSVLFDGRDMTNESVQDRDLGFVFQGYALFKHMTVANNIVFGPKVRKMDIDTDKKVQELLDLIELSELGGRFPPQLSGGQKQRVAVARALACDPRLLLLDEPFGALDPIVRRSLRMGLKAIVQRLGVTTIMVTHDQEEAWDIADHVVIFNHGRIEQQGTPEEIARGPVSPFVMNFVGDTTHVPSTSNLARRMGLVTEKSYVMFRPADITLHKTMDDSLGLCPVTVEDKAHMGWAVRYYLKFDDGVHVEISVGRREEEEKYDLEIGQRVYVRVEPSAMMPFDYSDLDSAPHAA